MSGLLLETKALIAADGNVARAAEGLTTTQAELWERVINDPEAASAVRTAMLFQLLEGFVEVKDSLLNRLDELSPNDTLRAFNSMANALDKLSAPANVIMPAGSQPPGQTNNFLMLDAASMRQELLGKLGRYAPTIEGNVIQSD